RPQDHRRRELPALERALLAAHHSVTPAAETTSVLPDRGWAPNFATEPHVEHAGRHPRLLGQTGQLQRGATNATAAFYSVSAHELVHNADMRIMPASVL
ncbi:MAG TPA: hypothetical protein VD978_31315, partial [Azospirillum sp.]|nr:hypothetical protein [Azospirillum sp.]